MTNNDIGNAARSMMNSPQGMKIIKILDKMNEISGTENGKQLIEMLAGSGADVIKNAASSAKNASKDKAKAFLSAMLESQDGTALLAKIIETVGI